MKFHTQEQLANTARIVKFVAVNSQDYESAAKLREFEIKYSKEEEVQNGIFEADCETINKIMATLNAPIGKDRVGDLFDLSDEAFEAAEKLEKEIDATAYAIKKLNIQQKAYADAFWDIIIKDTGLERGLGLVFLDKKQQVMISAEKNDKQ